jgi:hypothetical protein
MNNDLQNHVNDIARRISEADFDRNDDGDECSAFDYLQDALDIEYIVASDRKTLLGARVLVAFGGPNIWVNTRTNTVEGHWWGESASATFEDSIGLQDALEELFQC